MKASILQFLFVSAAVVDLAVCFSTKTSSKLLSSTGSLLSSTATAKNYFRHADLVSLQASRSESESSSGSSSDQHQNRNNDNDDDISSSAMSDIRKARLEQESSSSKRFASGEELKSLREDLESLRHNLEWAKALKDEVRVSSLTKAIKNGQNRDPYFMYSKALRLMAEARKMKDASQEEKDALTEKWSGVADAARQVLPEFSMEGLWVGNYGGKHGTQVVNITYSGDELIATKCTGDQNVPRGEVSFTVNLEPGNISALPPIQLISDHRKGEFRRFPGKGQVSRRGFKDHRYVEGQMILFDNQFSFVWIPTKHHVLFHRPSPEMTLQLLRNTISKEDEIENMRDHLTRCFDMDLSTAIARQQHAVDLDEPLRRITTQEDLEEAEQRIKESNRGNIFYQMSKWREYIDHVLDGLA